MKRSRIFIGSLLLCCVLFALFLLFPRNFLLKVIEWELSSLCSHNIGELSYESVDWENKALIFKNGKVKNPKREEFEWVFETARLIPKIDWKKRHIVGELELEEASFVFAKKIKEAGFSFQSLSQISLPRIPFFRFSLNVKIKPGEALVYDFSKTPAFFQKVLIDGQCCIEKEGYFGSFHLILDEKVPPITIELSRVAKDHLQLLSSFSHFPLASLSSLFHTILGSHFPQKYVQWHATEGILSGTLALGFRDEKVATVEGNLSLEKIKAKNPSLSLQSACSRINTSLFCDFSAPQPFESFQGIFEIEGGALGLDPESDQMGKGKWELTQLSSKIIINNGKIKTSFLHASSKEIKGELILDWFSPEKLIEMHVKGPIKDFGYFFPSSLNERFLKAFPTDSCRLDAYVTRMENGIYLDGKLHIKDEKQNNGFVFGCRFGKEGGIDGEKNVFLKPLREQFYLTDNFSGWIEGKNLALEKYLSPFLFYNSGVRLSGVADLVAKFNRHDLSIQYQAKDLVLESNLFKMRLNRIDEGAHFLSFESFEHTGTFPLHKADYYQKNLDLAFADIEGNVRLQNHSIFVEGIKTHSEEVSFLGAAEIDVRHLQDIELRLNAEKVHGTAKASQKFLSHFTSSFFCELPIDGEVSSISEGAFFHLLFKPNLQILSGKIQGELKGDVSLDGAFREQGAIDLKDYSVFFDYDYLQNHLEFSEGQAELCFKGSEERFSFVAPMLRFYGFPHDELTFECQIWNHNTELVRLAGEIIRNPDDISLRQVHLNPECSHVNQIGLRLEKLVFKEWRELHSLDLALETSVSDLLTGLKWLQNAALFAVEPLFWQHLAPYHFDGAVLGKLAYAEKQLSLSLRADQIYEKERPLGPFLLKAKKKGAHFSIDECNFCGLTLMADGEKSNKRWDFHFLGLRSADFGHVMLAGSYDTLQNAVHSQISELKIDFNAIAKLPRIPSDVKKWLTAWGVKGNIQGGGEFYGKANASAAWEWKARVQASFKELELGGIPFGEGENLTCDLSSHQGLMVEGLQVEINDKEDLLPPMKYKLGKLRYSIPEQKLFFEGFEFSLPPERLPWVRDLASRLFFGKIPSKVIEGIEKLKSNAPLNGRLSLELAPESYWFHLSLEDGLYSLGNKQFELKDFSLVYDSFRLAFCTRWLLGENDYAVDFEAQSPNLSDGRLRIRDRDAEGLRIHWERRKGQEWAIQKITGTLSGLDVSLFEDPKTYSSERVKLVGSINIDGEEMVKHLPTEFREILQKAKIGSGYLLQGNLSFAKKDFSKLMFSGKLIGQECYLAGIQLFSLESDVYYIPGCLELKNFQIKDRGGNLQMDDLLLIEDNGHWVVNLSSLKANQLRFARFRGDWCREKRVRNLIVRNLEVNHFSGVIGNPSSFKGNGQVQFTNYPKKGFIGNILLVPTDIIARIGLDLTLLVPVSGVVLYEIKDGRVCLTKFKDVYSDGRRSRFYLERELESYIDFAGNLNIQIRMKQYSLLMKIAELFTLTVKGTIDRPSYSFKNHLGKSSRSEKHVN